MGDIFQLKLDRVLAVDDHPPVLQSLKVLLEHHRTLSCAGFATDGNEAVAQAYALRPDFILMDANMPRKSGVEAAREIRRFNPEVRILFYSADASRIEAALCAGARGFVQKACPAEILLKGIEVVLSGGIYIDEGAWARVQKRIVDLLTPADALDEEERAIGPGLIEGLTSKEIAARLDIKTRRVEKVRTRMMKKFGVRNAAALSSRLAAFISF